MSGQKPVIYQQFFRYSAAGAVGTGLHYVVLVFAVQQFRINPVVASMIGAFAGAVVNYGLNYHFIFWSTKRHREVFTKFSIVASAGFVLNAALMYLLVNAAALHYLISQVLTTLIVLFCSFVGNKAWSFRE